MTWVRTGSLLFPLTNRFGSSCIICWLMLRTVQTLSTSSPISLWSLPAGTWLNASAFPCSPVYEIPLSSDTSATLVPILPNEWQLKGVSPCWVWTVPTGACGLWWKWSAFHREIDGTSWVQKPQQEPPCESDCTYAAYQSLSLRHGQCNSHCYQKVVKKDSTNSNL